MDLYSDIKNRPYAVVNETQEGDILIADAGWIFLQEGQEVIVQKDADGNLFIEGGYGFYKLNATYSRRESRPDYFIGFFKK